MAVNIILFIYGVLGFVHSATHHDICSDIKFVDCKTEALPGNKIYLDNHGKYYDNFCTYSQAKCKDSALDLESVCTCQHPDFNSNPSNVMSVTSLFKTTKATTSSSQPTTRATLPPTSKPTSQPITKMTSPPVSTPTLQPATRMTLPPKSTPTAGQGTQDPVLALFCNSKDNVNCGSKLELLCASDGKTYQNQCAFAKSQCDNPLITIVREGPCSR